MLFLNINFNEIEHSVNFTKSSAGFLGAVTVPVKGDITGFYFLACMELPNGSS